MTDPREHLGSQMAELHFILLTNNVMRSTISGDELSAYILQSAMNRLYMLDKKHEKEKGLLARSLDKVKEKCYSGIALYTKKEDT